MEPKEYFSNIRNEYNEHRGTCLNALGDELSQKMMRDVIVQRKKNRNLREAEVSLGSPDLFLRCPDIGVSSIESVLQKKTGANVYLIQHERKMCADNNHIGFLGYDPRPKCTTYLEIMAKINWK